MTRNTLDLFRLDSKTAVVTGGAGTVGRAIVRALAEAGALVVAASRDAEHCEEYARELSREGLNVEGARCDLASEQEIRAFRDTVIARHRTVDVVFNNALARHGGDLRHTTAAEFEASLQVNATGLMLACQLFSEPMQERRSGSIVNIGSIYGSVSPDFPLYEGMRAGNRIDYAFVKGGMLNLTRYLACYLAPFNVRVNCLSPGAIQTPNLPAAFVSSFSQRVPLGRLAEAWEMQGAALFLASDASTYVTGQNIVVDGGWTAI
jgi:NAD(P)-dependent dehydrogenase (short-subunit alcohol dehydrogenase family)